MPIKKTEVTVMTMNLRFGLAPDGKNSWQNRKALCARLLYRYPCHFIGVQESNHFQTEFLMQNLPDHSFIGWHNRSKIQWQSNLIFYHNTWTCLGSRHYFLSSTPAVESRMPGSKWPRQCVIGMFQNAAQRIIVANTHFDFNPWVQKKSASLVIQFLADFPGDCPFVITGDFNANPDSMARAVFQENGFLEPFDNHPATTFHNFKGEATKAHIDWILYRGNINPIQKKIIKDAFDGQYPSDHYPVRVTFQYGPKQMPG